METKTKILCSIPSWRKFYIKFVDFREIKNTLVKSAYPPHGQVAAGHLEYSVT